RGERRGGIEDTGVVGIGGCEVMIGDELERARDKQQRRVSTSAQPCQVSKVVRREALVVARGRFLFAAWCISAFAVKLSRRGLVAGTVADDCCASLGEDSPILESKRVKVGVVLLFTPCEAVGGDNCCCNEVLCLGSLVLFLRSAKQGVGGLCEVEIDRHGEQAKTSIYLPSGAQYLK
ncbi:hypothetical protein GE09DRAFT_1154726, partial [Coniochaeta sp. 2T2.1]